MGKRSRGKVTAEQRVGLLWAALDQSGDKLTHTQRVVLAISYAIADDDGSFTKDQIDKAVQQPGMWWAGTQLIAEWELERG